MATAAPTCERCIVPARLSSLVFLIKASRPGLWATAVWFYLLPLGGRNVFHSTSFWLGVVYVTLPLGLIIYGWNDIADAEIDRFNPRKGTFLFGARGSAEELARLPLRITAVQMVFVFVFWHYLGAKTLIWFAGLVAFTAIYNLPRYGLKSHPPFDILNQAGYLLVFVLSSWQNHAPLLRWPAMLFGALFAMHSHIFGEVMDIEPDRMSGRRTTATVIGALPAKLMTCGMLIFEAWLVAAAYHDLWIPRALAFGALWFMWDAMVLWRDRPYTLSQMKAFMIMWNVVALGSMAWVWSRATFVG